MKIFISGASGLVGRDLITYLLKENHKILATYRNRRKAQKEIAHKNLKWKKIDLKKPIKIKQKIDIIIHCAVAHPFSKKNKTENYVGSNILSLINITEFAKKSNTKLIINLSSLKYYGKIFCKKLDENYSPMEQDFLGVTKLFSERYLEEQPVNFVNLRLPGVLCLSKNNPRPWLQTVINKIKNNQKIDLHNIDTSFNNVIDTQEVARFILKIINKKNKIRDTFNFSASKPIRLRKIIEMIKIKYNSQSKIINTKSNAKSYIILSDKLRKFFKFKPISTSKIIERNI